MKRPLILPLRVAQGAALIIVVLVDLIGSAFSSLQAKSKAKAGLYEIRKQIYY